MLQYVCVLALIFNLFQYMRKALYHISEAKYLVVSYNEINCIKKKIKNLKKKIHLKNVAKKVLAPKLIYFIIKKKRR